MIKYNELPPLPGEWKPNPMLKHALTDWHGLFFPGIWALSTAEARKDLREIEQTIDVMLENNVATDDSQ